MPYIIDPKVIIDGVVYTEKTISGVTLTNGRNTVDEQPRAGYASIILVTPDNEYPEIAINGKVVVKVDDSDGTEITLWSGWVSDIETSINNYGSNGWLNQQKITAIGSLSKLNRRLVGADGYPKEFDGQRIYDIILEGAAITWEAYEPQTETWANVNPLLEWQTIDLSIGVIDRPGDFELTSYSGGESSALSLAQTFAASGLGIVYEDNLGKICYNSYSSRTDDVSNNGFTPIDTDAILASNLSSVSRFSDLANSIEVIYKNNQIETGTDIDSIAKYGLYAAKVNTVLENQPDAEQRVDYYLETRAYPRKTVNSVTLALHLDNVSDAMRDSMLPMRISEPIKIVGLPSSVYPKAFEGFVEGYTWTINRNELFLTLNVSEYALSQLQVNWAQVPPAIAWEEVNAALEWQEARAVA
jgi:hypothetical protein